MPSTGNILDVARDNPKKTHAAVPETVAEKSCDTISQKQRIDAEMRLIFRSSTFTTLDPADDPRFA